MLSDVQVQINTRIHQFCFCPRREDSTAPSLKICCCHPPVTLALIRTRTADSSRPSMQRASFCCKASEPLRCARPTNVLACHMASTDMSKGCFFTMPPCSNARWQPASAQGLQAATQDCGCVIWICNVWAKSGLTRQKLMCECRKKLAKLTLAIGGQDLTKADARMTQAAIEEHLAVDLLARVAFHGQNDVTALLEASRSAPSCKREGV